MRKWIIKDSDKLFIQACITNACTFQLNHSKKKTPQILFWSFV